jgi:hypothetical protein
LHQLHASGVKTIIVGNQPPQGCSCVIPTTFSGSEGPDDNSGCLDEYNKVNRVLNIGFQQALTNLQQSYKADGTLIIQLIFTMPTSSWLPIQPNTIFHYYMFIICSVFFFINL